VDLSWGAEHLTAGGENTQAWTRAEERLGELRARLTQMLAVVENEEKIPGTQPSDKQLVDRGLALFAHVQCPGHVARHESAVGEWCEIDEEAPIGKVGKSSCRCLEHKSGLADAADAAQRQEPSLPEQFLDLAELRLTTDKARQRRR